ncbi:MAG: FAD binding domain-containing protein [Myxococcales bacterium]|jgi:carbon-monoxide dehydrogenase medium subunit|nr:FAD binding domain-containing protein [Myxococcales bacterium]
MLLPHFDYRAARSIDEALALANEGISSRFMAGGTDLIAQMRIRLKVERVIDLKKIPGLDAIAETDDGGLEIGATAVISDVCRHALVQARYPALVKCASELGAYALRNRATVVGNVCNGSPAADTSVALLCLDALAVAVSQRGERLIPLSEFFIAPGKTARASDEIITAIRLPAATSGMKASYNRLSRRRGMDLATVAVLTTHGGNAASKYRIGLVAVAPRTLRVPQAEALLDRQGPSAIDEAAAIARDTATPISDARGTADYRRAMVFALTLRGLAAVTA